jgi:hypothetical protein
MIITHECRKGVPRCHPSLTGQATAANVLQGTDFDGIREAEFLAHVVAESLAHAAAGHRRRASAAVI